LMFYFAHEGLRNVAERLGAPALRTREPFVRHALCWLAFPQDYTAAPTGAPPSFMPWTSGAGACMLEALQPELARRWIEVESNKERLTDPQAMRVLGLAQERVLTAFLDAIEQAGRMDLARFLLQAAARLLGSHAHAGMWTARLNFNGQRVADRAATYQAATIFLRTLDRLQAWARRARGVGYFDEGYAASQLWKADWEQVQGDRLMERARAIVQQLDPMRQTSS
jgi:CubicO group peptidase (beta-lactamase class C family)